MNFLPDRLLNESRLGPQSTTGGISASGGYWTNTPWLEASFR